MCFSIFCTRLVFVKGKKIGVCFNPAISYTHAHTHILYFDTICNVNSKKKKYIYFFLFLPTNLVDDIGNIVFKQMWLIHDENWLSMDLQVAGVVFIC